MYIHLINFRCHLDATFEFSDDAVIRLKSEPGDGKSTIFEAICWVLYGNMRDISNHLSNDKVRTKVTLRISLITNLGSNIQIYRQNHPNRLILTIGSPIDGSDTVAHEDVIAQQIIDAHFGSKRVWSSVSYLRQGNQCVLLNGSKDERYELLQEIAAQNDDPVGCIQRIDDTLKIKRVEFRDGQAKLEAESSLLNRELDSRPILPESQLNAHSFQLLSDTVTKLGNQYKEETIRDGHRQQLIGTLQLLQSNVTQIDQQLTILINGDNIDNIKFELSNGERLQNDREIELMETRARLEQEEERYRSITAHIQNSLSVKLTDLTNRYNMECDKERRRQQLVSTIEHAKTICCATESTLAKVNPTELLTKERQSKEMLRSDEDRILRQIQDYIAREELDLVDRLNSLRQSLSIQTVELNNQTGYLAQLSNQITSQDSDISQTERRRDELVSSITSIESRLSIEREKIDMLSMELGQLPETSEWPTLRDVGRVGQIEESRNRYEIRCKQLQVSYDSGLPTVVDNWQGTLGRVETDRQTMTEMSDMLKVRNQLINMMNRYDGIVRSSIDDKRSLSTFRSTLSQNMERYRELIVSKRAMTHRLICPSCSNQLKLIGNQLVMVDQVTSNMADDKYSIEDLQCIISHLGEMFESAGHLERLWRDQMNVDKYLSNPTLLEEEILKATQYIDQVKGYLNDLKQIEWIEPPSHSSQWLNRLVELKAAQDESNRLISEMSRHRDEHMTLEQRINSIRKAVETNKVNRLNIESRIVEVRQLGSALVDQISNVEKEEPSHTLVNLRMERAQKGELLFTLNNEIGDIDSQIRRRQELETLLEMEQTRLKSSETELAKLEESVLDQIQSQMQEVKESIERSRLCLNETTLKETRETVKRLEEEIKVYHNKVYNMRSRIENIDGLTLRSATCINDRDDCQTRVNELGVSRVMEIYTAMREGESRLIEVRRGMEMMERRTNIMTRHMELNAKQVSLAALEELRQLAVRVQYKSLEDTIVSINSAMGTVFQKIFDDDIHVELKLFREIKSKKRETPHVNCIIHYKGAKYGKNSLISGGEKNRVNLGMILALNLVSASPIIILDECTNFLNNRLRAKCIAAIRKMTSGGKTVLVVCHEDNDANYDAVIPIIKHAALDYSYPIVNDE